MIPFAFQLTASRGTARAGKFVTEHGIVETPIFMPVGTQASVKSLDVTDLETIGAEIILANTYHVWLRPGTDVLRATGGIHQFSRWQKPLLTDSGGFQVWSLAQGRGGQATLKKSGKTSSLIRITDDGVSFRSHLDGSQRFMSPEVSIQVQHEIGSDIMMAFDEAMPDAMPLQDATVSLKRTHRWAERCITQWEKQDRMSRYGSYQALFGIIQGALHQSLRAEAAQFIADLPFDGIALGGETIGYNMSGTVEVMGWIEGMLPVDKPRYAMGLGRDPQDIVDAVLAGFDMFDCVGPTRLARNGGVYQGTLALDASSKPYFASDFAKGRLSIGRAEYATDNSILNQGCHCATCRAGYSRAYLHHLYKTAELSYYRLASVHNLWTMVHISKQLRNWIETGSIEN